MFPYHRCLRLATLGLLAAAFSAGQVNAQNTPAGAVTPVASATPATPAPAPEDGVKQAETQMQQLLDEAEYFYKSLTDNGRKYFVVLLETENGKSQIYIDIDEVGTSEGKTVYGFIAYAQVAQAPEGQSLPPGVIKLVASENNKASLGYFSMSKDYRYVYSMATGVLDGLSKRSLKMTLLYLHENRIDFSKTMEPVMKEASS